MEHQLSLATCRLRRRSKWPSEGSHAAPVQMDTDLIARRLRLPVLAIQPAARLLLSAAPKRKVASSAGARSRTADAPMDGR